MNLTTRMACLASVMALAVTAGASAAPASAARGSPEFRLKWQTSFSQPASLGSFADCDNDIHTTRPYCSRLPASLRTQWWAYPDGWPDTATEEHYRVGGYYDPAATVWISGHQMHIRMWRGRTGSVHSAALVPRAAIAQEYGEFTEAFRVSSVAAGYKSAHLLTPTGNLNYEIDFPEDSWDRTICAFDHGPADGYESFCPDARWTSRHTTMIVWVPGHVSFYLDGKLIGRSSLSPDGPMTWVIQNESALNGETAAPRSHAQMNISHVAVYAYKR
ncbi:MAG TPA: hypothetical protein VMK13_14990 [Streptosporangiaceae bacterium]|nr:hypothetical protein [Streptosporangiaceae bacterium]